MDNIEQLKQDNAKLTERLNNAAKFFREQKAQIEQLTKENEQLKNDNNVKDDSIRLNNELLETVENLKKEKEELEKKFKEQESFETDTINKVVPELEEKVKELEKIIVSKDQAHKVLQDTYNEIYTENEKYKKQLKEAKEAAVDVSSKFEELKELNNKLKEDLEKRVQQIRATEKTYDIEQKKIMDARDEYITKYKELETKYNDIQKNNDAEIKELIVAHKQEITEVESQAKKIMDTYEADIQKQKEEIIALNTKLGETESNLDKLNIRYNNLENEKLAIESDFNNLQDKFNNLENDYTALENKTEIYSKSDDVLAKIINIMSESGLIDKNATSPQTTIKEGNVIHRMGDNMVGGINVGV